MKKFILLSLSLVSLCFLFGCGSHKVEVAPLSSNIGGEANSLGSNLGSERVCIESNPTVTVSEFLPVVEDGFARHGIRTRLYQGDKPEDCVYTVKYNALRSWDFKTFLAKANVYLYKDGNKIAGIDYYHANNLNMGKYDSVKQKIDPLMDEMLAGYPAPRQ